MVTSAISGIPGGSRAAGPMQAVAPADRPRGIALSKTEPRRSVVAGGAERQLDERARNQRRPPAKRCCPLVG